MGKVLPAILAAALVAFAAAPAAATDQAVSVSDNSFVPARVAVQPGESVTWTASGINPHNVTFEDGGLIEPQPPRPGPWTTTRAFPSNGAYPYYCQLHGGSGGAGMSGVVFVNASANVPPVAVLTASPNPAQVGQTVTFTGSGSSDSGGAITKYEWDLDGNGSFETDTGGTPTAARSYTSPGVMNVQLRVTDNQFAADEGTLSLRINAPPARPIPPPLVARSLAAVPVLSPPSFVASKRTITVGKDGRFRYSFVAGAGLTGTIGFRSTAKVRVAAKRRISLGAKRFTVPSSGIATVRVKLSRGNLRILRKNARIKFRATVTLRNATGSSRNGTATFTLKRPRRR